MPFQGQFKEGEKMNRNFLDTVYLFACGARGIEPQNDREYDFKEIYRISKQQGIWETVFLAVIKLHDNDADIIPRDVYETMNTKFITYCGLQYKRQSFVHRMIEKLEDNGVVCCVLKGESIAGLYHTPIARISSDTDILINPQKLDLCLDIMKKMGFSIGEKHYGSHQIECMHPVAGLVEIHIMMYGKQTEELCFNHEVKYSEEYMRLTAEDGAEYSTLGVTDNFLFLMLHFIKHFLSFGVGIRQLEDVLIYAEKRYSQIDWKKAEEAISNLGFSRFFECMISIGKKYFYFPTEMFAQCEADEGLTNRIFEDMQQGGMFGHDDPQREGFYNLYLRERCKKLSKKNYESYQNKQKLLRLFPSRGFMAVNYSYVNKSVLLLPVAWVHRIVRGVMPRKNIKDNEVNRKNEERLKLMSDLDMI